MRKPIIAGNWKMNMSPAETVGFINQIKGKLPPLEKVESVIAAPAIDLTTLVCEKGPVLIAAAENCHFEDQGAYTGETSPKVLNEIGITYVIVGHSERRRQFFENDESVNKKVHAVFRNNLLPIVCCGETLEIKKAGKAKEWVEKQIRNAVTGLTNEQISKMVLAYEPIWAIGNGQTAKAEEAQEVCHFLREILVRLTTPEIAQQVRIQYGGSVTPANVKEIMAQPDIDGVLVGGAALNPESFLQLVNYQNK